MATKRKQPARPAKACASLMSYSNGGGDFPGFRFTRHWWQGKGMRTGIADPILKKLCPGSDSAFGSAARVDVVLPDQAPGEYASIQTLVRRYDEALPSYEFTAFAHLKITVAANLPLHLSWEMVRAFALSHIARDCGLAGILILHDPSIAGSANAPHVHLMVPGRKLGINGFGEVAKDFCSDKGHKDSWIAWQRYVHE